MENKEPLPANKPFFNHYHFSVPPKSKLIINPEIRKDAFEQTRTLKFIRGHFLDYIIELELIVDLLIEKSILHKKSKLWKVFRTNIINHRSMTFKPKIELLCGIIKEKKEMNESNLKLLNNYLNILRDERDKWAHGAIHFKQEKVNKKLISQSYLVCINSKGEESQIKLVDSYFDDLTRKLNIIKKLLNKILIKRGLLKKSENASL